MSESAERSHVQGTGLGLALCRQLITAMSGTIALTSVKGAGATFTVRLRRATSTDTAALVRATAPAVLRHIVAECTVLYVEDNLATVALVFISALGGHEFKWKEVLILSVILVLFSVLVFVKGLTLPFPICPQFIETCPIR